MQRGKERQGKGPWKSLLSLVKTLKCSGENRDKEKSSQVRSLNIVTPAREEFAVKPLRLNFLSWVSALRPAREVSVPARNG